MPLASAPPITNGGRTQCQCNRCPRATTPSSRTSPWTTRPKRSSTTRRHSAPRSAHAWTARTARSATPSSRSATRSSCSPIPSRTRRRRRRATPAPRPPRSSCTSRTSTPSWTKAVDEGATITEEIEDKFWGDRFGTITDPFGHVWSIGTHVEDVSPQEMAERAKSAMAAMSG